MTVTAAAAERGGPVGEHDLEDRIVQHRRAVDTLQRLYDSGTVDDAMYDAGRRFETLFARAALDPLHAASLERVVGERSRGLPVGDAHLEARRRLHRALDALGGVTSPAGSCAWAVLGEGRSLREWTLSQGWRGKPLRQEAAQGVLVATLGVLAGHDGRGRPPLR